MTYTFTRNCVLILALLTSSCVIAADKQETSGGAQGFTFHSDDFHLTTRINQPESEPFSTAVDTVQLLMNQLDHQHAVANVSLNRSFVAMSNLAQVCVLNKVKNRERQAKYTYSIPLNVFNTQRFYQLANLSPVPAELLDENNAIKSIRDVLQAYPQSAIVLPRDYTYGDIIDDDLAKVNEEQIIEISNATFYSRFMQMFANQKAEFALVYPSSIYNYFGAKVPVDVRSFAIAGNPEFVTGHVICPASQDGRGFIDKINTAIQQLYRNPQYLKAHLDYLPDNSKVKIQSYLKTMTKAESH